MKHELKKTKHTVAGDFSRRDLVTGGAAWTTGLAAIAALPVALAGPSADDSGSLPFQLKDLTQIAFVVKDIEDATKRYADLFGVKVPRISTTDTADKAHTLHRGAPTPARAKLSFFSFGAITIELIEPIGGPSTWKECLDKNGEGVHHLGFRVRDMKEALAILNGKGFATIQTGDFTGGSYAYVDTTPVLHVIVELLASTKK